MDVVAASLVLLGGEVRRDERTLVGPAAVTGIPAAALEPGREAGVQILRV
jgi:hypothetical protein